MVIGPQLIADLAIIDVDAGADETHPRHLSRRAGEPEQVGELDPCRKALDRAERRGEIHVGGREGAAAARPLRIPFDPALSGDAALDQSHHADGQRGQRLGLEALGEGKAGHFERSGAGAGAQMMVDAGPDDARAALRMGKPASGVDAVVGQSEAEIVADERMEAGRIALVGDAEPALDQQVAALYLPAAAAFAEQQRHVGDLAGKAAIAAGGAAGAEAAVDAGDIEPVQRLAGAQPRRQAGRGEAAGIDAQAIRGDQDRRASEPAGEARAAQLRPGADRAAGRLPDQGRSDRTERQPRRADSQSLHLKRLEGGGDAAFADREPVAADVAAQRQGQAGHLAAAERPVEAQGGGEAGAAAGAGVEAYLGERQPGAAGADRRDPADAFERRPWPRLAEDEARIREAAARQPEIAVELEQPGRPAIAQAVAADPGKARAAAAGEAQLLEAQGALAAAVDQAQPRRRLAAAGRPHQSFGERRADRPRRSSLGGPQSGGDRTNVAGQPFGGKIAVEAEVAVTRRHRIVAGEAGSGGAEHVDGGGGRAEIDPARGAAGIAVESKPALEPRQILRAGREPGCPHRRLAAPLVERRRQRALQREERPVDGKIVAAADGTDGERSAQPRAQIVDPHREIGARPDYGAFAEAQLARDAGELAAKAVGEVAASGEAESEAAGGRIEDDRGVGDVDALVGEAERQPARRRQQPVDLAEADAAVRDPAVHPDAARGDQPDPRTAEPDQDLHLHPARGRVRPARVADHQIFEHLRAEADPLDLVAGLDAAAGELAIDIVGGEPDPDRPQNEQRAGEQQQCGGGGDPPSAQPRPPSRQVGLLLFHARLTRPAQPSSFRRVPPPSRPSGFGRAMARLNPRLWRGKSAAVGPCR